MMKQNVLFPVVIMFGLLLSQIGNGQVSAVAKMGSSLKSATERMVICRSTKAVRTLRIEKKSGDQCQTFYTKAGVDQNIGKSQNVASCLEYLNKVRETLEKAQWACKDIKVSTLSTITESVN
jgi:hypothetical protein